MMILAAIGPERDHERIVSVGVELAEAHDDELKLVHVAEPAGKEQADDKRAERATESSVAEGALEDARAEGIGESVSITAEGRTGDPVEEVLAEVDRLDPRFLLVGSRRRSPVGKVVFGSVTRSLLFRADCPVVTVTLEVDEPAPRAMESHGPVVAAVDRSPRAERVAREGASLADALGTDLRIVHVLNEREFVELEQTSYEETGRAVPIDEVKEVAADFATQAADHAGVDCTPVGLVGDPAGRIESYAEREDASYVVVSSRRRSSVGKAVFGSVAQSVVLSVDQPVLVTWDDQ